MCDQTSSADPALAAATAIVCAALENPARRPKVKAFFDEATFTVSYVVRDPGSKACAIIDSVLDYDAASGRTAERSAGAVIDYVRAEGLQVVWQLETHAHADHLSAAPYLQNALGGRLAIGDQITRVQETFGALFNAGADLTFTYAGRAEQLVADLRSRGIDLRNAGDTWVLQVSTQQQ